MTVGRELYSCLRNDAGDSSRCLIVLMKLVIVLSVTSLTV